MELFNIAQMAARVITIPENAYDTDSPRATLESLLNSGKSPGDVLRVADHLGGQLQYCCEWRNLQVLHDSA